MAHRYRRVLLTLPLLALAACGTSVAGTASPAPTTAPTMTTAPPATTSTSSSPAATPMPKGEDAAYLGDLAGLVDAAYLAARQNELVTLGHTVCDDYRRGVDGVTEADRIEQQLVTDTLYKPGVTDPQVRKGAAAIDTAAIGLAANANLCPDVNPW